MKHKLKEFLLKKYSDVHSIEQQYYKQNFKNASQSEAQKDVEINWYWDVSSRKSSSIVIND